MNLYITGHGYEMKALPDAVLKVPANFQLKFYCKRGQMFDSSWEGEIVKANGNVANCPNKRGVGNWEVTTIAGGGAFDEHCLTRPGKMRTFRHINDMKEIEVPYKGTGLVNTNLADGDILCIKGGGKLVTGAKLPGEPWLSLSALMVALARAMPGGAVVHWCACRSVLDDPAGAIEQAESGYLGTL